MKIKSFEQIKNINHQTILLRVDFNVPVVKGKVKEDFKIRASAPMIEKLSKLGAKIVLVTHLGEPVFSKNGKVKKEQLTTLSTKQLVTTINKAVGQKIRFISHEIGDETFGQEIAKLKPGQIALIENIRFHPEEMDNSRVMAKILASYFDIYINNAFAASHRDHVSVSAIKKYLPSYAGSLVIKEVESLHKIIKPQRPSLAIIGGSKIDTKIKLIKRLVRKADHVLIGGALANNFIASLGYEVGKSMVSGDGVKIAKKLKNKKIIIPCDVVVQNQKTKEVGVKMIDNIAKNDSILDIGPDTMKLYASYIKQAKTIVWNGPMGKFEEEKFRFGTLFVARAIASRASGKAFAVVGGGETVEAVNLCNVADQIDWVSTGGGASLSFLGGEKMPGLKKIVS